MTVDEEGSNYTHDTNLEEKMDQLLANQMNGAAGDRRTGLEKVCKQNNIELISPPKNMFGDNAAMIALACIKKLQKGDFKENIYFKADPRLQITQKINEILVS